MSICAAWEGPWEGGVSLRIPTGLVMLPMHDEAREKGRSLDSFARDPSRLLQPPYNIIREATQRQSR